jgi:ABC-type Fe3+ transport system permease subunit
MPGAARLLFIPIALLALLAALVPLSPFVVGGLQVLISASSQPGFAQDISAGLVVAAAIAAPALVLGLWLARILQRVSAGLRTLALTTCVALLLMPSLGVSALPSLHPPDTFHLMALMSAVVHATAAVTLVLTAGLARITPALLVAARAAGARPGRAWRDAILAPLVWPLLLAVVAAFLVGLAEELRLPPPIPEFWVFSLLIAAPMLLVAVASISALSLLLRRRPA